MRNVKAVNSLDKPKRADGDQLLLIWRGGVILAHDVGNEAQVVYYQLLARRGVAIGGAEKRIALFIRIKRGRKTIGRANAEHYVEQAGDQG